ncbi:protein transcription factor [Mesorhizobium sp. NBSH29]|uniref:type II toxin-antitoxin system VapB family antitoxin n=1 Tax=Mesorhizobium sp. NBSH29 TaxID=2654249 RepID=UPI0018964756|nr:type II toxin-antitoxin system VapB family antitoxin [Mesorhizobium sp. NBSH29]QPC86210.1 protein transcription factor [Mesorhizobium sp. NBSH29]
MPLYIRDPEVDRLAEELVNLTGTTKVEAVRIALGRQVAVHKAKQPIRSKLARSLEMARAAGPFAPGDHKAETDALWGEG